MSDLEEASGSLNLPRDDRDGSRADISDSTYARDLAPAQNTNRP